MIKGYKNINVGCSHEEMIPNWLGLTIWGGKYDGLIETEIQSDIQIYQHEYFKGHVINHNVNEGLPFDDDSISTVYSSHFIEHLSYKEAKNFFKESYRTLEKGGVMRTVCPDISIWGEMLYKRDEEFFSTYHKMLDIDYFENYVYDELDNLKTPAHILNGMIYNWGHKWMWDFESLKHELELVGFRNVRKKSHLDGNMFEIDKIENILSPDKIYARNLESLFVEAVK